MIPGSLVINWLVPEPFPGAGGDVGLFRIIRHLAEFGHRCRVYVVAYELMQNYSDDEVRAYISEHFGPTRANYSRFNGTVGEADATFATFWPTAEELLKLSSGGRKYYLVQDFEPAFYPREPNHYERAEATYRAGLRCITLGPWLAKLLRVRYAAVADHFDFAVDTGIYHPQAGQRHKNPRISFYARPATPRRAYELGVAALGLVKERIPESEICFFGTNELVPEPSYPHRNCGKLGQAELADLFAESEVGVVLSLSNPSFVPLEMMACGCAVVETASERWTGVLTHGENAWLVAPSAGAVARGIVELIENSPLREKLIENGLALTAKMSWRDSARKVESILQRETAARIEPVALALPSRNFRPRRYGLGAWTEHIYFAYDLIAQLKPAVVVELGTDRGESYFAFCQSVAENETTTRSFAIDHWQGDPHAGSYDETTFNDVESHNRSYYSSFSTLLQSTFDEALPRFADKSIDLLHLDGHHTEEAVWHDLRSWLPKLRPGGILLMHDVTMRGRGFGVWKVWEELLTRGRGWTFESLPGLGVWEKAPSGTLPPLLELLIGSPNDQRDSLMAHYRHCFSQLQATIDQQWADGSIRFAPMASETVIQVFWTGDGNYREENSTDVRIGHGSWREIVVDLQLTSEISGLRIDFYSAVTRVEISRIGCEALNGGTVYEAKDADGFAAIRLMGDCVRRGLDPFIVEITGVDPQLHLPVFSSPVWISRVRMRLRVQATVA
jgi:glycosyltransferase involved in cell wall biosynthesis/predicted O-methyltransferase YrrM